MSSERKIASILPGRKGGYKSSILHDFGELESPGSTESVCYTASDEVQSALTLPCAALAAAAAAAAFTKGSSGSAAQRKQMKYSSSSKENVICTTAVLPFV